MLWIDTFSGGGQVPDLGLHQDPDASGHGRGSDQDECLREAAKKAIFFVFGTLRGGGYAGPSDHKKKPFLRLP